MSWLRLAGILVPALCACCREGCERGRLVCEGCLWDLDAAGPIGGEPPVGIEGIVSVAPHDGIGRTLIVAYKFRGLHGLGEFMSARMADAVPAGDRPRAVVPVPASNSRKRFRGFDPAGLLAAKLAEHLGWPLEEGVLERTDRGRQKGGGREERIRNPPTIRARTEAPREVLLVDDVATTGSTLAVCAGVLRSAGTRRIQAVTFTRRT